MNLCKIKNDNSEVVFNLGNDEEIAERMFVALGEFHLWLIEQEFGGLKQFSEANK